MVLIDSSSLESSDIVLIAHDRLRLARIGVKLPLYTHHRMKIWSEPSAITLYSRELKAYITVFEGVREADDGVSASLELSTTVPSHPFCPRSFRSGSIGIFQQFKQGSCKFITLSAVEQLDELRTVANTTA